MTLRLSHLRAAFWLLAGALPATGACSDTMPTQAQRQPFRPQLHEVVWHRDAVYTSDTNGLLQRWDDGSQIGVPVETPGPVHSMCVLEGRLYIATQDTLDTGQTSSIGVFGESDERWESVYRADSAEVGNLFGLTCEEGEPLLLTGSTVRFPLSGKTITIEANKAFVRPGEANLFRLGETLWLGFDLGEWGGGLHRIDLQNGARWTFEAPGEHGLCEGLLNASCDPVHAIVQDVSDPNCIVLASGLSHFLRQGYLARACPDGAEMIRSIPVASPFAREGEVVETAPFTSLASNGQRIFALEESSVQIIYSAGNFASVPLGLEAWPAEQRIDWSHPDFVIVDGAPIQSDPKYSYSMLLVPRP